MACLITNENEFFYGKIDYFELKFLYKIDVMQMIYYLS